MTDGQIKVLFVFLDNLTKLVEQLHKKVDRLDEKRGRPPATLSLKLERAKYRNGQLRKENRKLHALLNKEMNTVQ